MESLRKCKSFIKNLSFMRKIAGLGKFDLQFTLDFKVINYIFNIFG